MQLLSKEASKVIKLPGIEVWRSIDVVSCISICSAFESVQ